MNATIWKEYADTIRTVEDLALESTGGSFEPAPPVPAETMLQWLTYFQITENATREVDIKAVLAFVQEPAEKKKRSKKGGFRSGVADLLMSGQKRQEMLYGNMPFSQLQEKCARWTLLLYAWIHTRVTQCRQGTHREGLEHEEVERYLHFLATASPLLGAMPTDEIESHLLSLDKGLSKGAPKCGMADETQQLHAALADCIDAANRDSLMITWDFIRPSSVPTIVLEHLGQYAAEWLNAPKGLRPATEMGYIATFVTRKPHRRSSSTPPQSSSFIALQYLWETKAAERKMNFSARTLYQFEWTLGHIGYLMLAQLSAEKIDRAYFAVPVLVDLTCATEAYKELREHGDSEVIAGLHQALPSMKNSPDGAIRALQSAVDLCFERHAREILKTYKDMDPRKDVVEIDGTKQLVVSTCMFRLLVEVVEPTLCLLRRYGDVLATSTASCPCWQKGLERSVESLWRTLTSTTLRMVETVKPGGDDLNKRLISDQRILNSYLRQDVNSFFLDLCLLYVSPPITFYRVLRGSPLTRGTEEPAAARLEHVTLLVEKIICIQKDLTDECNSKLYLQTGQSFPFFHPESARVKAGGVKAVLLLLLLLLVSSFLLVSFLFLLLLLCLLLSSQRKALQRVTLRNNSPFTSILHSCTAPLVLDRLRWSGCAGYGLSSGCATLELGGLCGPPWRCDAALHCRLHATALITMARSCTTSAGLHSPQADAPVPKRKLQEEIAQFIPVRFTTISQIARSIPEEVMEALQEQEDCGLMQFLSKHPKLFEVTRVAGVLRAKLRHGPKPCEAAAPSAQKVVAEASLMPSNMPRRLKVPKRAPKRIYDTYPTYCIPFAALQQYTSSVSPELDVDQLWKQLGDDEEFVRVTRLYKPSDPLNVQRARTFLMISPECCALPGEVDTRYVPYAVEPYEWFRIARVSPFTRRFLAVTPTVLLDAAQLLPPGRDPLHVWASAPELFECCVGDGVKAELDMIGVRFILHPSYMAAGESRDEGEIIRQIEELGGQSQRLKKKRRRLRRALQCVQEPLSFLDERVWAHYIFDSLPVEGSAAAEKVVSMLPEAYKNCTPVQWRSTLQKFPMLFKLYNGPTELVVQRADLPALEMRTVGDITPDEILQEIYRCYPLRFHPEIGVTISQMLTKLPRNINQRLYSLSNVEGELLLRFPDKVEILRQNTFFVEQTGDPPVYSTSGKVRVPYKNRSEMLLQVRGRSDFLLGFRFVGEWQERLLEKFAKRCQKYDCDPNTTGSLPLPVIQNNIFHRQDDTCLHLDGIDCTPAMASMVSGIEVNETSVGSLSLFLWEMNAGPEEVADLDAQDESHSTLYDEAARKTWNDLVDGGQIETCWPQLVQRHDMFRDVAREAKKLARERGNALMATVGVLQHVSEMDGVAEKAELALLRALGSMYLRLYTRHCTVTRSAWCDGVRGAVAGTEPVAAHPSTCASRQEVTYLSGLHAEADGDVDEDDGSWAEEQFRLFAKRCLQLGRKASRGRPSHSAAHSGGTKLKEIVGRTVTVQLESINQQTNKLEHYAFPPNRSDSEPAFLLRHKLSVFLMYCATALQIKSKEKQMEGTPLASHSGPAASTCTDRKRTRESYAPRQQQNGYRSIQVTHYPSHLPFPVVMGDDFPQESYQSRNKEVKSSIHWGQRKLIISEIQFLSLYCRPATSYHVVYVGSAPGTHIAFLDNMFEKRHTWELIDPGEFDRATLDGHSNIVMRNEFFTNAVAYDINIRRLEENCPALAAIYRSLTARASRHHELHEKLKGSLGSMDVARVTEDIPSMYEPVLDMPHGLDVLARAGMERSKPLLFVSDIRTGSLSMPNFEEHVAENMRAQESWTQILQADFSVLKFRLPYTKIAKTFGGRDVEEQTKLIQEDGCVTYLRGDILLPVWTRPTSTEGRLVVPKGARRVPYNVQKVEDKFYFFNARIREAVHFNHFFEFHDSLNHHFDPAAEVHCLSSFLRFINPKSNDWSEEKFYAAVLSLSSDITAHLGIDFNDAIRRRDALMLRQAREGISAHSGKEKAGGGTAEASTKASSNKLSKWYNQTKRLIDLAHRERDRPLWSVNLNEQLWSELSGVWSLLSSGIKTYLEPFRC
eukprot:gene5363-3858_t